MNKTRCQSLDRRGQRGINEGTGDQGVSGKGGDLKQISLTKGPECRRIELVQKRAHIRGKEIDTCTTRKILRDAELRGDSINQDTRTAQLKTNTQWKHGFTKEGLTLGKEGKLEMFRRRVKGRLGAKLSIMYRKGVEQHGPKGEGKCVEEAQYLERLTYPFGGGNTTGVDWKRGGKWLELENRWGVWDAGCRELLEERRGTDWKPRNQPGIAKRKHRHLKKHK